MCLFFMCCMDGYVDAFFHHSLPFLKLLCLNYSQEKAWLHFQPTWKVRAEKEISSTEPFMNLLAFWVFEALG